MSGELIFAIILLSIITLLLGFLFIKSFKQFKGKFLQGHNFFKVIFVILSALIFVYIQKILHNLIDGKLITHIVLSIILIGFLYLVFKLFIKIYIAINNNLLYKKLERMSNIYKNGGINKKEFENIRDEIKIKLINKM